jgi:hypothetical protein
LDAAQRQKQKAKMRIEAVTVCVDYADFLEVTLPTIVAAVDSLVVVTAPADRRTIELCRREHLMWTESSAMYDNGGKFSLGAALNAGLKALQLDGWVLVVDADIYLPPHFHRTLDRLSLDSSKLYGIDRVHCRGHNAAVEFMSAERRLRSCEVPFLREFPIGPRIVLPEFGYVPCGYFQLWNAAATGYRDYPIHPAGTSEGSDMMHATRFPRSYRELIPELVAIELGTDEPNGPVGVNWSGRTTPEFSREGGPYRRS